MSDHRFGSSPGIRNKFGLNRAGPKITSVFAKIKISPTDYYDQACCYYVWVSCVTFIIHFRQIQPFKSWSLLHIYLYWIYTYTHFKHLFHNFQHKTYNVKHTAQLTAQFIMQWIQKQLMQLITNITNYSCKHNYLQIYQHWRDKCVVLVETSAHN